MAKNTKQIALIQHRRGALSELPYQLNEGEFALATDTNDIFMGNPNNPVLKERVNSDEPIFPYGNIQLLTEFTDNMSKIKYTYKYKSSAVKMPIEIICENENPQIPTGMTIYINDIELKIGDNPLFFVAHLINDTFDSVKAQVLSDGRLKIISTDDTLSFEDGITPEGSVGAMELLGIPTDINIANTPVARKLQDVIDDRVSIKAFNAYGDGSTDDYQAINNAIIASYGNRILSPRELYFPSGIYNIETNKSLMLLSNTHLNGEGIDRTIIQGLGTEPLFTTGNIAYVPGTSDNYKNEISDDEGHYVTNILVENMTISGHLSSITNLIYLNDCQHLTFRNVKFIGAEASVIVNMISTAFLFDITFENCIFTWKEHTDTAKYIQNGILVKSTFNNLRIINCQFIGITNEAINISSNTAEYQKNALILGNTFKYCGSVSKRVLYFGNNTSYINVAHSTFDKEVIEKTIDVLPYENYSDLNNIDTLDINEDTRKYLRFKFNQPQWDYIDSFIDPNGNYIIQSKYQRDVDGQVRNNPNTIIIEPQTDDNKDTLIYGTDTQGDISLGLGKYGTLNLGNYYNSKLAWQEGNAYNVDAIVEYNYVGNSKLSNKKFALYRALTSHTASTNNAPNLSTTDWEYIKTYAPSVQLQRDLDLGGNNYIRNSNELDDIKFYTENNNILSINDDENSVKYEYRIPSYDNAIPNVAYVNNAANTSIRERFNEETISQAGTSKYKLISFNDALYGDFVFLKRASFNVRRPFYTMIDLIKDNPLEWKSGLKISSGEVFAHTDDNGTYYYACVNNHISTNWDDDTKAGLWNEISLTGIEKSTQLEKTLNDVKYVSIYATNNIDAERYLFKPTSIDITRRDVNGNYYPTVKYNTEYTKNDIVLAKHRYWKCLTTNTPGTFYDLHNENLWECLPESGYNYVFDFERNLYSVNPLTGEISEDDTFVTEYNFSKYDLYLEFYDENGKILPIIENDEGTVDIIQWSENTDYKVGQFLSHDGKIYAVLNDFTSGVAFQTIISGQEVLKEDTNVRVNTSKIQVNPSGSMILTLDYFRG